MLYRQSGSVPITNNNYAATDQISVSFNAFIENTFKPEQYLVMNVTDSLAIPTELRNQAVKIEQQIVNDISTEFLYFDENTSIFDTYPEFLPYTRLIGSDQPEQLLFSNLAANIEMVTSQQGTGIKFGVSRIASETDTFVGNVTYTAANLTPSGDLWLSNHLIITSGIRWAANGASYAAGATGSYSNSDVALYLASGSDVTINSLQANITAANTAITTANAAVVSYINTNLNSAMIDRGPDQPNWNLITQMGIYLVNRISWSGTIGTPVDTANYKGALEVINTQDTAITQNYRPYDTNSLVNVYWTRSKFNGGAWSQWIEIVNNAGYMDGGNF